jgi:Tol biopolymer transport system component
MRHNRARAAIGIVLAVAVAAGAQAASGGDSAERNGRIVFQASVGKTRQLFTIEPDGTGLRQVTHIAFSGADRGAEQPDWSPDGDRIAFDAPVGDGTGLFVMRADGSGLRQIALALGGSSAAPTHSPDGASLAFDQDAGRARPTARGIFVAAADGSSARRVTTGIARAEASDTAATWSPEGRRLCFTRVRDVGEAALFVVRVDGSGLRRLTPWSLDASAASWSPDGSRIAFESYSTPHAGRSANLFTMSPDGGAMTQLTRFAGGRTQAFGPAWSPDGRRIVWHKIGPGVNQLFVMDSRGRSVRRLTHMAGNAKLSHADWGTSG